MTLVDLNYTCPRKTGGQWKQ